MRSVPRRWLVINFHSYVLNQCCNHSVMQPWGGEELVHEEIQKAWGLSAVCQQHSRAPNLLSTNAADVPPFVVLLTGCAVYLQDSVPLLTSGLLVQLFNEKSLSVLWGTFYLYTSDSRSEAPLEQTLWVWWLIITVQLAAHEMLSESLWTRGTGSSCMTGSLTGISCWKTHRQLQKIQGLRLHTMSSVQ